MKYLLDSNVLIQLLRPGKGQGVRNRLATTEPEDVATCSVVRMELVQGAFRSRDREKNLREVESLLQGVASIPFDDVAADRAAELNDYLLSLGKPIGGNDLLIAAIAAAHGLILVTHNYGEFSRIPGLSVEDWQGT